MLSLSMRQWPRLKLLLMERLAPCCWTKLFIVIMHLSDHRPRGPKKVDLLEVAVLALDEDNLLSYNILRPVYIMHEIIKGFGALHCSIGYISVCRKSNEWSCQTLVNTNSRNHGWFKLSSHGPPCHLFYTMADVTSVSDSENLDKTTEAEAKVQADSVRDDADSEVEEASEFEIEEVLDAKRGYFPEVCTANWN